MNIKISRHAEVGHLQYNLNIQILQLIVGSHEVQMQILLPEI
jgi:hypothetical protein